MKASSMESRRNILIPQQGKAHKKPSSFLSQFKFSKGDVFGGLTAGVVALPLALAFGVQSGLGAEAGLYGAIFLGFFAAALGGTTAQISGPTGPMTVVSAATIVTFTAATGSTEQAFGAIIVCFVLAGIIQIAMGILKIGSLIKYIPYPVISGFMSGIGVIIILLQIFPALGNNSPAGTIGVFTAIGDAVANINYWALLYASLTIAIIYLFPRITKAVPSTLVALLAVTLLSVILPGQVPLIGSIPAGFPELRISHVFSIDGSLFMNILAAAATLAALGSIDSLLTSVIADNITKTKHQSNQELIGQGIGNTVAGLFGGLPGAGATMRTLVNIRSGGKHRMSGIIHSLTLLIILVGAGTYAAMIPLSVLAGILITVGIGILDYKGLRDIRRIPRADAAIMIIVLLATVFLDLIIAVGVGMVMASLLFMKKMSDITAQKNQITDVSQYEHEMNEIPKKLQEKILIKHMDGPLFFGFASDFQQKMNGVQQVKYVVIRMEKVPFIDQTGLYALEESVLAANQRGIQVLFTGLQEQPEHMLRRIKLIPNLIAEHHLFGNFSACIAWLASEQVPD